MIPIGTFHGSGLKIYTKFTELSLENTIHKLVLIKRCEIVFSSIWPNNARVSFPDRSRIRLINTLNTNTYYVPLRIVFQMLDDGTSGGCRRRRSDDTGRSHNFFLIEGSNNNKANRKQPTDIELAL